MSGNIVFANIGWLGLVLPFAGYLVGVRLVEAASWRLRSIVFIKSLHLLVFILISILLADFLYEVTLGHVTYVSWLTVGVFLAEGIVLRANRGRCPLTAIAESLGSKHGQVTDTFLPKWFADRAFAIYTYLFAGALVLFVVRVLV